MAPGGDDAVADLGIDRYGCWKLVVNQFIGAGSLDQTRGNLTDILALCAAIHLKLEFWK